MNNDFDLSSSSDDICDWRLMDYIEESESMQVVEDSMRYIVTSTIQQPSVEGAHHKKQRTFIPRDLDAANNRLIEDYFNGQPLYDDIKFRRRFRMKKHVFLCIVNTLIEHDKFFQQGSDAIGRLGASALQKCTVAIRMLAYGTSADQMNEYLKLGASSARECLAYFVDKIVVNFSSIYLSKPTAEDVHRLLIEGERRGFPEAFASWDTWIWHAFFGTPWSNNDIDVLQRSPVFDDILNDRAPQVTYNLIDGIYPKWVVFIDAIFAPQTPKQRLFTRKQEGVRKDVEHAFGVLQARFAIIRYPALA